jgi:hypothetical protein
MSQPPDYSPAGSSEPQAPPQHHAFEFSAHQYDVIRSLSKRMHFVGTIYLVASIVVGLAGLVALIFAPMIAILYFLLLIPELLVGIWTIHAAHSFRQVVDTTGHDIPHLMKALSSLQRLYTLMFWMLLAALAFVIIAIAAAVFMWLSGLMPGTGEGSVYTLLGS